MSFTTLGGCAQSSSTEVEALADRSVKSLGCWNFKDELFDGLYENVQKSSLPARAQFEKALRARLMEARNLSVSTGVQEAITSRLGAVYELLTSDALKGVSPHDAPAVLEMLTALELGDRTSEEKVRLQDRLASHFSELERETQGRNSGCAPEPEASLVPLSAARDLAFLGARKAFAVSYQSCQVQNLPALNDDVADVKGISIVGDHPSGGKKRVISDLNAYVTSNYYLRAITETPNRCLQIKKNPLIYDFGGKPSATSAADSKLDFFKNAGSGTETLGIDCSGFVFSALATSGLKLKKDGRLKAISVFGISARMYMNPKENGLTCIEPVKLTATNGLRRGDIIAQSGHVVMVDSAGEDPFSIAGIEKAEDCTGARLSPRRYDFVIVQSSPTKGGMGINKIRAADYLQENIKMANGLRDYAIAACKARFGQSHTVKTTDAVLVRHSGTSDCMDTRVKLQSEECVAACTGGEELAQVPPVFPRRELPRMPARWPRL